MHIHQSQIDSVFLVLSYVKQDMKTVMQTVAKGTRLTDTHVKTMLYNSLLGLNYLHKLGVVHRDIKPANLLMGENCLIKICDFGLARRLPSKNALPLRTIRKAWQSSLKNSTVYEGDKRAQELADAKLLAGSELSVLMNSKETQARPRQLSPHVVTRVYRAPEVMLMEREYDTAVDIWALGVVLQELLSCT